jgi:hypothetical protein
MSVRIVAVCLLIVGSSVLAPGQHGTADPGYYAFNYHGDTWTGTIASFDRDKGIITLTYEHKEKVETFTGALKPPLQIVDENGNAAPAQVRVQVGDRLTAYYIAKGQKYSVKDGSKRHDEVANDNLIFEIKLLSPQTKH